VRMTFAHDDELQDWESLSDAEIGARVRDGVKRFRSARDANGNVASSKEIEFLDHTADDPAPTPGTPAARGMPERPGASLAASDSALEELTIRQRAGANMDGELLVARARRSDPVKVRTMTANIPGYDRLK
jgi:hypothetical protein